MNGFLGSSILLVTTAPFALSPSVAATLPQEPPTAPTTAASAQDSDQRPEDTIGQEIVVTATKRSERLQDVPLAVSAVGGADLLAANARSFVDFARSIPGLSFSDYGVGRQKPSIRGISVNTGAAAVGYYIDETPLPSTTGTLRLTNVDPNLYDLDRVEVLRGPQGTLYGSGSMGGTIKLITRRPNASRFEGSMRTAAEIIERGGPAFQFDGMVNVPVVRDQLAVRGVFSARRADGFIDRRAAGVTVKEDVPRQKVASARVAAEYNPTDSVRLNATVFHEKQEFNGFQTVTFGANNPDQKLVQNFLFDTPERNTNSFTLYNLTGEFGLPFASVVTSTSLYRGKYSGSEETGQLLADLVGPAFASAIPEENAQREFTQEIRISSLEPIGGLLDWIVGGFYRKAKGSRLVDYVVPEYAAIVGSDLLFFSEGRNSAEQKALFGEVTIHASDALELTGGIRWYDVTSKDSVEADGLFNGGPSAATTNSSATGFVKKVNVAWKPTKNALLYAQAAEGFRPGFGRSPILPICLTDASDRGIDPNVNEVLPDKVWNYELGAKTTLLDGRGTFNLAAFQIDWSDIQLGVFLPCGYNIPSNAGDARSKGVEVEAVFDVTDRFEVGASFSYTDAKFTRITPGILARPGDPLLEVPKFQGSAHASVRFNSVWGGEGFARVEVQHTGESLLFYDRDAATAPAPLEFRERESLTLVNARVQFGNEPWTLALYARNLTNDVEVVGFADMLGVNLSNRPRFTVNTPRTFGIEASLRF